MADFFAGFAKFFQIHISADRGFSKGYRAKNLEKNSAPARSPFAWDRTLPSIIPSSAPGGQDLFAKPAPERSKGH